MTNMKLPMHYDGHYTINAQCGVEVQLHEFLTSTPIRRQVANFMARPLNLQKKAHLLGKKTG
jgi:hypothetical protein